MKKGEEMITLKEVAEALGYKMSTMYFYRHKKLITEAQKRPLRFYLSEVIEELSEGEKEK